MKVSSKDSISVLIKEDADLNQIKIDEEQQLIASLQAETKPENPSGGVGRGGMGGKEIVPSGLMSLILSRQTMA